jgi:hypothetical protein
MTEIPNPDPNSEPGFLITIPPELWDSYYYALGKFMHMFGRCEDSLNANILIFSSERLAASNQNKSYQVLRALIGGMRVAGIRDTIKGVIGEAFAEIAAQRCAGDVQ